MKKKNLNVFGLTTKCWKCETQISKPGILVLFNNPQHANQQMLHRVCEHWLKGESVRSVRWKRREKRTGKAKERKLYLRRGKGHSSTLFCPSLCFPMRKELGMYSHYSSVCSGWLEILNTSYFIHCNTHSHSSIPFCPLCLSHLYYYYTVLTFLLACFVSCDKRY